MLHMVRKVIVRSLQSSTIWSCFIDGAFHASAPPDDSMQACNGVLRHGLYGGLRQPGPPWYHRLVRQVMSGTHVLEPNGRSIPAAAFRRAMAGDGGTLINEALANNIDLRVAASRMQQAAHRQAGRRSLLTVGQARSHGPRGSAFFRQRLRHSVELGSRQGVRARPRSCLAKP